MILAQPLTHGRRRENRLSCASRFHRARSSADQSIGLRSQGSWVRIPPGAPPSSNGVLMKSLLLASSLVALAAFGASASAQQYPTRNITMLVPYAAGGSTDTVARVVAQAMTKSLGH